MIWKVFINGKDSGIIETNLLFATQYWGKRKKVTGEKIELRKEQLK